MACQVGNHLTKAGGHEGMSHIQQPRVRLPSAIADGGGSGAPGARLISWSNYLLGVGF